MVLYSTELKMLFMSSWCRLKVAGESESKRYDRRERIHEKQLESPEACREIKRCNSYD